MSERVLKKENKLKVHSCHSWEDFRVLAQQVVTFKDGPVTSYPYYSIYRGHEERSWKLSSLFERTIEVLVAQDEKGNRKNVHLKGFENDDRYERYCKAILERFRENSKGMNEIRGNESENELWAIGRHFGLLTPLLDWTTSPYIATFFALSKIYHKFEIGRGIPTRVDDGISCVWALHLFPDLEKENDFEVIEAPTAYKSRPKAQCGRFTKLICKSHLDLESYLEEKGLLHFLEVFEIHHKAAIPALHDLNLMNINLLTLFPDLHGAAVQANIEATNLRLGLMDYAI